MLLNMKQRLGTFFGLAIVAASVFFSGLSYGAINENLDVSLGQIYLGTRSPKDFKSLSETALQYQFPLTKSAEETGAGLFGGITYYDNKMFFNGSSQLVNQTGVGRVYYFPVLEEDSSYTFLPFLTFYRSFLSAYNDASGKNAEIGKDAFLLPGVLYAYRFNEDVVFHLDMELYSYERPDNSRGRSGFSYKLNPSWVVSAGHERIKWNVDGNNAFLSGHSIENNLKLIYKGRSNLNLAFSVGSGHHVYNAYGSGLFFPQALDSRGIYFGIEGSSGVLAW